MAAPGERVLDVCAAPGGKSTAIAVTGAFVVGADLQAHRVALVAQNAASLGTPDVAPLVADGTQQPFAPASFHHVLLDAPCSGLGTLRRRSDARWRITEADVATLTALQQQLIDASAPLVKAGGTFTYSVCTLLAAESIEHAVPAGFSVISEPPAGQWRPFGPGWRVLPHDAGTDGMVVVRYRRES